MLLIDGLLSWTYPQNYFNLFKFIYLLINDILLKQNVFDIQSVQRYATFRLVEISNYYIAHDFVGGRLFYVNLVQTLD